MITTARKTRVDFMFVLRIVVTLEREVKAKQHATGMEVSTRNGRSSPLTDERVFVVKGKTCAAGDKWVIAVADHERVNVAEIGGWNANARYVWTGHDRESLPGHTNQLVTIDKDELRIEHVVRFKQPAVPGGSLPSHRQTRISPSAV